MLQLIRSVSAIAMLTSVSALIHQAKVQSTLTSTAAALIDSESTTSTTTMVMSITVAPLASSTPVTHWTGSAASSLSRGTNMTRSTATSHVTMTTLRTSYHSNKTTSVAATFNGTYPSSIRYAPWLTSYASPSAISTATSYTPLSSLCTPGTFFCTSDSTFSECMSTGINSRMYVNMGLVPAGMQCVRRLSVDAEGAPYEDDEIVRSRPLGACEQAGSYECLRSGAGFAVCDQGAWVDMGAVAVGTQCVGEPGQAAIVLEQVLLR